MKRAISQTPAPRSLADAASRIRSVGEEERARGRGWARIVLVPLAALSGLFALAMLFGPYLGWSIVRLASGSMAPGLPTNSLLLVHRVQADQVSIGDVVMLSRDGRLPVTHRVVSIAEGPLVRGAGASGLAGVHTRVFVLKGDANAGVDLHSYTTDRLGLMVAGVPWGGQIVTTLRSPFGLGFLTIVSSVIVLQALWPRPSGGAPRHLAVRR